MLVRINNVNMTKYINDTSYSMDSERKYVSWKDGNYKEHRKYYPNEKVSGQFTINLGSVMGLTAEDFLSHLANATDSSGNTTMDVWVNNKSTLKAIECFYTITSKKHTELSDGTYLDILTLKITEA